MKEALVILGVVIISAFLYFFILQQTGQDLSADGPATTHYYEDEAGNMVAMEDGFYTIKDPVTKEPLKIDGRHFSASPNNIAGEQNWTVGTHDFMTLITPRSQTMKPYYIDSFEAVISYGQAWSTPGQIPTDRLKHSEADAACRAINKRLCTESEWRTACRGGVTEPVKFQNLNQIAQNCDVVRKDGFTGLLSKTDEHPECSASNVGVYNMIGNVSEFVNSDNGEPMIVGLSFEHGYGKNIAQDLAFACEKTVKAAGTYRPFKYYNYRGFRCCRDAE